MCISQQKPFLHGSIVSHPVNICAPEGWQPVASSQPIFGYKSNRLFIVVFSSRLLTLIVFKLPFHRHVILLYRLSAILNFLAIALASSTVMDPSPAHTELSATRGQEYAYVFP